MLLSFSRYCYNRVGERGGGTYYYFVPCNCFYNKGNKNHGKVYPPHVVQVEGQSFKLICHSLDRGTWSKDGGEIYSNHDIFFNTLEINDATERDSGIYTCQGIAGDGRRFVDQVEVFVAGKGCL